MTGRPEAAELLAAKLWLLRGILAELRGEPPPPPRPRWERYELRASCLGCGAHLCVPVKVYLPGLQELPAGTTLCGEELEAEHQQIRERMEQVAHAQLERALKVHRELGHQLSEVQHVELPA